MANENDKPEPKKRSRLFGGRKSAAQHVNAAPAESALPVAEPVAEAPVAEAPVAESAKAETPAAERTAPSRRRTAQPVAEDAAEPEAPKARATRSRKPAVETEPEASEAPASEKTEKKAAKRPATTSLLFQAPDLPPLPPVRAPRGGSLPVDDSEEAAGTVRRRSRRRPGEEARDGDDAPNTVVRVRQPRPEPVLSNEPTRVKGSTRLEAKKQRRRR